MPLIDMKDCLEGLEEGARGGSEVGVDEGDRYLRVKEEEGKVDDAAPSRDGSEIEERMNIFVE